eukprot:g31839.t1
MLEQVASPSSILKVLVHTNLHRRSSLVAGSEPEVLGCLLGSQNVDRLQKAARALHNLWSIAGHLGQRPPFLKARRIECHRELETFAVPSSSCHTLKPPGQLAIGGGAARFDMAGEMNGQGRAMKGLRQVQDSGCGPSRESSLALN